MHENFAKIFEVRWADVDINWHLRNTAYADYGTDVRLAYLRENGFPPERFLELGIGPVVLREEFRYLHEVRLGEKVHVNFVMQGVSEEGSHWEARHDVFRADGELAAILQLEGGWLSLARRRLIRPPEELARLLNDLPRTDDFRVLKPLAKE